MAEVLYLSNDNLIELTSLTNSVTSALIGAATVGVTVMTSTGGNVTGATGLSWPITLDAVTGATGNYRATLPYTLSLTNGASYTARVTASAGGIRGQWDLPVRATTRTS